MTIEDIKRTLAERGMTQQELANALSISYSSMRQILSGASKLTEQLSKHIEYVLDKRKQQTFIYTVDLPEGTVRSWVPGFDTLSPEEQQKALHAICRNVLAELVAKGAERLTDKERAELQELIGQAPVSAPLPAYGKPMEPFA